MLLMELVAAAGLLAAVGFFTAVLSSRAATDEETETELLQEKILGCLPGTNCGVCGFSNCAKAAMAVSTGEAPVDLCTAGGSSVAQAIGVIVGTDAAEELRMRAQVICSGGDTATGKKYIYDSGAVDCAAAVRLGGGDRSCRFACLGLGSCAVSCPFDAIEIVDGTARVTAQKCTGCGTCVNVCPKRIIRMIPYDCYHWVGCASHEGEESTRYHCNTGCTGCGACANVCPNGAIQIQQKLASIDYTLCTGCGSCYEACPTGVIWGSEIEGVDGLILHPGKKKNYV